MSNPSPKLHPWSLVLGAGFSALAPISSSALPIIYSTPFSGTANVSDTCTVSSAAGVCANGATAAVPQTLAAPALTQFDPDLGVMTGTTLSLQSTRTQTLSGNLTGGVANVTSTVGKGGSNGQLTAPGVTQALGTLALIEGKATVPAGQTTASFGPVSDGGTATNTTLGILPGDLNTYVGTGTVISKLTAPTFFQASSTWQNTSGTTKSSSKSSYTLGWNGKLDVQYDYLLHTAPSFNGGFGLSALNLNFGTVYLDDVLSPLTFQIFNLAGERVALDLDAISPGTGSTAKLTTNLSPFLNLAAGSGSALYSAFFNTSEIGVFGASYQLSLSDQDIGATATQKNDFTLTLNLSGTVIARPTTPTEIPEIDAGTGTGAISILAGALALVGEGWRRRIKKAI